MYEDKNLSCVECSEQFVFSASEQEFYAEKGFQNEPRRCAECRAKRKSDRRRPREMYKVVCDECGASCQVPFLPKEDKPVFCNECYSKKRDNRY